MPEILNAHVRALAQELEMALPVPEGGFTAEIFTRASMMRVLAGPTKEGFVFVPLTLMHETGPDGGISNRRYRRFHRVLYTGDMRLKENDKRRRVMISQGIIFSVQEICGDLSTLVMRSKLSSAPGAEELYNRGLFFN